jgi:hypothetical protein
MALVSGLTPLQNDNFILKIINNFGNSGEAAWF